MLFSELAIYFDKIQQNSSRLIITEILAELFNKLTNEEIEKVVYLLQGRIAPAFESVDFGMAERMIVKAAISALNIERSFFEKQYKKIGDLGATVEEFKKEFHSFEEQDQEVIKVYDVFSKLAKAEGPGSQDVKVSLLSNLIRQLDPVSSRFLVRIPTGNIRMGFSDMTILDAFSWMKKGDKSLRPFLQNAYHVRPELGFIGRLLKEDNMSALKKIGPKVFTPIIMMRAERMSSAEEILKQLGDCLVEPKFDGFRLQVHKKDKEVKLFSRSLEDVTFMYPDIVMGINNEVKIKEAIFEGEAIGYSIDSDEFLPFQETVTRKRKYDINEKAKDIPLKLFAFDILYADGVNYINIPFDKRRKLLESIIPPKQSISKNTIFIANQELVSDEKILEDLFDKAISKKLEGVIAKKINGVYSPGARASNWVKYKKSYSSKIHDTIDCLVMGFDYGKGKRTGFGIGAFLVGIYNESKEQYLTIAKIGTGLTDEEWKELKAKSQKSISKIKPENYIVDKMMSCDVWISPSIVVEIKADEITKSPVHTAGLALRFPRLERFRDDKKPIDSTSLEEIQKIFESQ